MNKSADANKDPAAPLPKLKVLAATTRLALVVRESGRFWTRVAFRRRRLARYRLRGSGIVIHLRHGTADVDTFDEIFRRGHYDLPAAVADALRGARDPLRVVDLGANIGLFDARIRHVFPDARITAFEPHPANTEVLKRSIEASGGQDDWRLIPACADVRDGTVPFSAGEYTTSRIESSRTATMVPAVDVFPFFEDAHLVKIDIEGGEWRILSDPRFRRLQARAIALEYHPHDCPVSDPGTHAQELLAHAGYDTEKADFDLPPGQGMIWAWKRRPEREEPRARKHE